MKNEFEIRGDVAAICLRRRNGTVLETLIDLADLPKAQSYSGTWYAHFDPSVQSYYVAINVPAEAGGKRGRASLHRVVTDPPPRLTVDHKNHDTLDNRRSNLRLATMSEQGQNRRGVNRGRKYDAPLGVTWEKAANKWRAHAWNGDKLEHLGLYDTKEEAGEVSQAWRAVHYPFSQAAMNPANAAKYKGPYKPRTSSGVRGVCWDKEKRLWMAYYCANKRSHFIGRYKTIAEAEAAVLAKKREIGRMPTPPETHTLAVQVTLWTLGE